MMSSFLNAFATLFVTIDPLGQIPIFLAMVAPFTLRQQRQIALRGCLIALGILLLFAVAGEPFLALLGVSLPAFQIAGGVLLFMVALEMVFDRRSARRQKTADAAAGEPETDASDWQNLAIFPLAIPLLAGSGSMTSLILLSAAAPMGSADFFMTLLAVVVVLALTYGSMVLASAVGTRLNAQFINVITRLMGVILAALSAQYILSGLQTAFGFSP